MNEASEPHDESASGAGADEPDYDLASGPPARGGLDHPPTDDDDAPWLIHVVTNMEGGEVRGGRILATDSSHGYTSTWIEADDELDADLDTPD